MNCRSLCSIVGGCCWGYSSRVTVSWGLCSVEGFPGLVGVVKDEKEASSENESASVALSSPAPCASSLLPCPDRPSISQTTTAAPHSFYPATCADWDAALFAEGGGSGISVDFNIWCSGPVVEEVVEGGLFIWAGRQSQGWAAPLLGFPNGQDHSWSEWKQGQLTWRKSSGAPGCMC